MIEQDKENIIWYYFWIFATCTDTIVCVKGKGDNTVQSDIDIAIDNQKEIDFFILSSIKEAIEESSIPFMVDVVDLQTVSQGLKAQIMKEGIVWK